ncbi:MAG: glycosyltransferase family 4 protein [Candidatus Rokubacteria bacterium]|nr:glycosyltransferase family 4 protein [Candidatus Rokubacteria bacterium]
MRILVDGQTLGSPDRHRGLGRYLISTLAAMLSLETPHRFAVATPGGVSTQDLPLILHDDALYSALDLASAKPRIAGEDLGPSQRLELALRRRLQADPVDLYWNPNPLATNVALPARTPDCAFVATVFDLIPLKFREAYLDRWPAEVARDYLRRLTTTLPGYDHLLAISWSTKADLIDYLGLPEARIDVVPLGVDACWFDPPADADLEAVRRRLSVPPDFLLYVGGFDFRKNMKRLVHAFGRFLAKHRRDVALVIVCSYDAAAHDRFTSFLRKERLHERVVLAGEVSDGDLRALYRLARALVFPSLYEGFGLPVLEAMACGTPVVAGAFSAIPEVLGDAGLYFDPYDVEDIADAIEGVFREQDRLRTAAGDAIRRARALTWGATARATLAAFERVVHAG